MAAKPLRRRIVIASISLGGVAVALGGAFVAWNSWTTLKLDEAKAQLAAAGVPQTIADLAQRPVADADNAAPLIEKIAAVSASETFKASGTDPGIVMRLMNFRDEHPVYTLDGAAIAAISGILDQPAPAEILALAREAADRPRFVPSVDATQTPHPLPFIGPLRVVFEILRCEIRRSASKGDSAQAAADLWRLMNLADHIRREPGLLTSLMRSALLSGVLAELEYLTAADRLPGGWAERFSTRLRAISLRTDVIFALDSERVTLGTESLENALSGKSDPTKLFGMAEPDAIAAFLIRVAPAAAVRLEYSEYIHRMLRLRAIVETRWNQPLERDRLIRELSKSESSFGQLSGFVVETIATVITRAYELELRLSATAAGLDLHRYRMQHGHYPPALATALPQSVATVQLDPFSGKEMIYRVTETTFAFYSIGPNRVDDGGKFNPPEHDDLGFSPKTTTPTSRDRN